MYILWFIIDIIAGFFSLGEIVLTIYHFTPCYLIISEAMSQFLFKFIGWMISTGKEKDEWYFMMIYRFLYFIIIFSSLIFNEAVFLYVL